MDAGLIGIGGMGAAMVPKMAGRSVIIDTGVLAGPASTTGWRRAAS